QTGVTGLTGSPARDTGGPPRGPAPPPSAPRGGLGAAPPRPAPPSVSNHLRLLRHLDLVAGRRDGRSVVYELHDEHVTALLRQVLEHVHHGRQA
ncbi:hypothetical protein ACFVHW_35100, partial [Streptomyces sp. NPDC127110]